MLDKELEQRGLNFVRYADDCNICVRSRRSAERVLESVADYIRHELKLQVNWQKSGVRECNQVKFLGHTIEQTGKIRISDMSIDRLLLLLCWYPDTPPGLVRILHLIPIPEG